jgi:hypothetical protein
VGIPVPDEKRFRGSDEVRGRRDLKVKTRAQRVEEARGGDEE